LVCDDAALGDFDFFSDFGVFAYYCSVYGGVIVYFCVWEDDCVGYVDVFSDGDVFSEDGVWSYDGVFADGYAFVK
jgi:hypothetical protein